MDLKASCQHDLSFPFHGRESASVRLAQIQAYVEQQGLDAEYLSSGQATDELENKAATMMGKEAAMWCPTGTMAQGIAARIHAQRCGRNDVLLHPTSHLLIHEENGYREAHGLTASVVGDWEQAMNASLLSAAGCAFVELPQRHNGGLLPSWQQLQALKDEARELELPLHMDGARLWSCRPYYDNRSYAEIADGFDSVYLSLYKDIGAIGGALLVGSDDFIAEARRWRTRLGGLLVEPWPMIFDALRLLDQRLTRMPLLVSNAQTLAQALQHVADLKVIPNPPQVNMFHIQIPVAPDVAQTARDRVAEQTSIWLGKRFWSFEDRSSCSLEVVVGENLLQIPRADLVAAFEVLSQELAALRLENTDNRQ
ncbi:MAG: hypothetical protein DHS20C11_16000 [Lysobacteraceae bacterium]|nr:MAG: hypothetical protein DHS20C11_16000 [Xanthomonadaceae bacterium]